MPLLSLLSTQQGVQRPTFLLRGLRRDGQRRLRRSFFSSTSEASTNKALDFKCVTVEHWRDLCSFADRFVSEQHPPAGPHEPGGHPWAHSRLRPLSGPCGLVQQPTASSLFWGEPQCEWQWRENISCMYSPVLCCSSYANLLTSGLSCWSSHLYCTCNHQQLLQGWWLVQSLRVRPQVHSLKPGQIDLRDHVIHGESSCLFSELISNIYSLKDDYCVFFFQIRAANLSGDCAFKNEAARFNFGLQKHHQVIARGWI